MSLLCFEARSPRPERLSWAVGLFVLAFAAFPVTADDMASFRSQRYQVVTNLPVDQARSIATHMDQVFDEYARRLSRAGFRPRGPQVMRLYLIDTRENYVDFLGSRGVNAQGTGGIFFVRGDDAGLATFVHGQSRTRMLATLQHEGFHQFAWVRIGDHLPPWANEGLAEYFGQAVFVRDKLMTGMVDNRRLEGIRHAIDVGRAFGFGELLTMSDEAWVGRVNAGDERAGLLYDQAWSMVHFLVHARKGRFQSAFMNYLYLIHRGRDSPAAFDEAFGSTDPQPFEAAWKQYVLELKPDPLATAIDRLGFLAEGARLLHESGVPITSLGQLKRQLQQANFWYRVSSHGISRTFRASDETHFQPPPTRPGIEPQWVMHASDDPNLPPRIGLAGLSPRPHVQWSHDDTGKLTYEVVLD